MSAFVSTLITAIITFAATNTDDIFILIVFFSSIDTKFQRRHIVTGQYLGFLALVLVSLIGFLSSFIIPQEWIGILGLAPIYLGIRKLFDGDSNQPASARTDVPAISSPSLLNSLLHPKTYSVAVVTFANGGDNIGIYIPLFASQSPLQLVATLVVFFDLGRRLVLAWIQAGSPSSGCALHVALWSSRGSLCDD